MTATVRRLLRAPSGRLTNLQVLVALTLTFGTGVGAVATGSVHGRWVVVAHGIVATVLVLLIPWKSRVVRAGIRRHRISRWASLTLAALTLLALFFGFGYSTGLLRSVAGVAGLWLHVAVALALVPLVIWHVLARRVRARRSDLSRRTLLRAGLLGAVGASLYVGTAAVVELLALPGATRRFTGSYETGSFESGSHESGSSETGSSETGSYESGSFGVAMPNTIWLADTPPSIDADQWRLAVTDALGRYEVTLAHLATVAETRRATLDCTSGWYAEQDWIGVPVSRLLREVGPARSLWVHSVTGYWVRIPVRDLDGLLLATGFGGRALSVGHGFPLRLVAPGRRGYWWVKWVDRIELQATPWWWQPPFPTT